MVCIHSSVHVVWIVWLYRTLCLGVCVKVCVEIRTCVHVGLHNSMSMYICVLICATGPICKCLLTFMGLQFYWETDSEQEDRKGQMVIVYAENKAVRGVR